MATLSPVGIVEIRTRERERERVLIRSGSFRVDVCLTRVWCAEFFNYNHGIGTTLIYNANAVEVCVCVCVGGGKMVYETIVSRKSGVTGALVIDPENGSCSWEADALLKGETSSALGDTDDDSVSCGGCLTWEGAQSLPLRIGKDELLGALPFSLSHHPGFQIVYSRTYEKGGKHLRRILRTEPFLCNNTGQAEECISSLQRASDYGSRRGVMVILNPTSGQGCGLKYWERDIEDVLKASGMKYTFKMTQGSGDARAMAKDLDFDSVDTLILIGGDGTMHEVLQGLYTRDDPERAREVAIGMIPTGSGNGFAASVGSWDVHTALWAIMKNLRLPMDIVSILQPETMKRWFMCLSTTFGFIANLDLDTEHLRWMGGARFAAGAVYEVMRGKTTQAKVAYVPKDFVKPEDLSPGGNSSGVSCPLLDNLLNKDSPTLFEDGSLPEQWKVMDYDEFQFFVLANTPCLSMGDRVAPTVSVSSGSLALVTTLKNSRSKVSFCPGGNKGCSFCFCCCSTHTNTRSQTRSHSLSLLPFSHPLVFLCCSSPLRILGCLTLLLLVTLMSYHM